MELAHRVGESIGLGLNLIQAILLWLCASELVKMRRIAEALKTRIEDRSTGDS